MPPSAYATCNRGCFSNTGENTISAIELYSVIPNRHVVTASGASGDVHGTTRELPKCMSSGSDVSSQAEKTGS